MSSSKLDFAYELPEVQNFRVSRAKLLTELPQVALALSELLATAHRDNTRFRQRAEEFLQLCQRSISERMTAQHVDEMLIQHLLTDQVFRAIFPESNFHRENHLARAMGELENCFFLGETRQNLLKRLESYFAAIRRAAASTVTSVEKQDFLKQVYEDFYNAYNPKDADRLGIIYTPQEAVRFIIEGCDWLTQRHFNKCLSDSGLEILDPCTGTGTFIVDLLDYWRGNQQALLSKFTNEVHANEISILPYYIACLNIEQRFYEITHQWREFDGAYFVNTLENWEFKQTPVHQAYQITVIFGNPPYNANQQNENDHNKNDPAPIADKRIKETYLAESTAQKTKLYDPYIRFFRWASDRLGGQGIVAFITNRSYLEARQADGLRKTFAKEFQEIWIVDLMSDVRKNPKISGTKHNIFGIQTGVAIVFLVRKKDCQSSYCEVHYLSLDDFLPAVEKRRWLKSYRLCDLAKEGQFRLISPNARGDWLNQPTEDWSAWLPLASKEVKTGKSTAAIFKFYSLGIATARDEWVYGFSETEVSDKTKFLIEFYQTEQKKWKNSNRLEDIEKFVNRDIKWTTELTAHLVKKTSLKYHSHYIVPSIYRPFVEKFLYYDKVIVHRTYQQIHCFPIGTTVENMAIGLSGNPHVKPFQTLVVSIVPCLDLLEKTQFLPLWIYDKESTRYDNITDWALKQFRKHYLSKSEFSELKNFQDENIERLDIFHYVYAVLYDPRYRKKFALNLKQEFPRIPFYPQFWEWVNIGKQLIKLHLHFEQVKPYPLTRVDMKPRTNKVRLKADKSKNLIEIDNETQLKDIPASAWQYQLGNRSALEWILDQYKEKTPKDATIREKFNTYHFADHKETVIKLLRKVCRVSVETIALIEKIEKLT